MVWFRVDDLLHDHRKARKVRRAPETGKRRDSAPFGVWVLAGSWCGANRTGGFIPLEILEEWDDAAEKLAARLVAAGLWITDEVDGEPGYRFHDWVDQNPAPRTDSTTYGRRGNHVRWHEGRGELDPTCEFCRGDDRPDVGATPDPNPPVPSRPDPTRPDPSSGSVPTHLKSVPLTDLDEDGIGKIMVLTGGTREHAQQVAAALLASTDAVVARPLAYVLRAIRNDPTRYRVVDRGPKPGDPGECGIHPGQWQASCAGCAADRKAGGR